MRQGQNNNRRGRNNNNRRHNNNNNNKPQNMLTKTFDSNGPDIKIRGNAATIAEKYMSLAHDALSAGSRIKAENYFQHAEHYKRIVSIAQEQQAEQRAAHEAKQAAHEARQAAIRAQKAEQAKAEADKAEKNSENNDDSKSIDAENSTDIAPSMITQTNEPVELIQQNDQDGDSKNANAKEEKPKRKPSTRPKRKPAPKIADSDEASATDNAVNANDDAQEVKEEKPKRAPRKPRAKKPVAKKDAEAETAPTEADE